MFARLFGMRRSRRTTTAFPRCFASPRQRAPHRQRRASTPFVLRLISQSEQHHADARIVVVHALVPVPAAALMLATRAGTGRPQIHTRLRCRTHIRLNVTSARANEQQNRAWTLDEGFTPAIVSRPARAADDAAPNCPYRHCRPLSDLPPSGSQQVSALFGKDPRRSWSTRTAPLRRPRRALERVGASPGSFTGGEDGLILLSEAATVLATSSARYQYAQTLTDLGAALRRANQRTAARGPLLAIDQEFTRRSRVAPLVSPPVQVDRSPADLVAAIRVIQLL